MKPLDKEPAGRIVAISTSSRKGIPKTNTQEALLIDDFGIEGDAHAGPWHRQVSFLAVESAEKVRAKGVAVRHGGFAENITTEGIDIPHLQIGERLAMGDTELEITQIGKECHKRCAIYYQAGDCVMPREGVFARVLRGGKIQVGDAIRKLSTERTG